MVIRNQTLILIFNFSKLILVKGGKMKKVPFGIAFIAILVIIEAVLELLGAFGLFGVSSLSLFAAQFAVSFALTTIGIIFLVIGLIELAVGVGLFNMERWAWGLTVIVVWIDLVADVIAVFIGAQTFEAFLLSAIIPVIVLVYMYQKDIRRRFN